MPWWVGILLFAAGIGTGIIIVMLLSAEDK